MTGPHPASPDRIHRWSVDPAGLTAVGKVPHVILRRTFEDIAVTPAESFRIDKLLLEAAVVVP